MKSLSIKSLYGAMEKHPKWSFTLLLITGIIFMIGWGKLKSSVTFHIDEIWQYSFANSNGKTIHVVEKEDFGKWLPATVFRDYITVQPDQRFSFRKITEADAKDIHPPLSHYALHIVSSFFPDKFSRWYGLTVNIIAYALTISLLYSLSNLLFASRTKALIATALWAFSVGAVSTVMYIRMYCMVTMFSVAVVLFSVKYLKGQGARNLFFAYCAFVLGGLADYVFWIFGFFVTLAFIIVQWNHNTRSWITFAAVSFGSFVTACLLFPTTLLQFFDEHSLSSQSTENFDIMNKARGGFDVASVFDRFLANTSEQALLVPPGVVYTLLWAIGIIAIGAVLVLVAVSVYSAWVAQRTAENLPPTTDPVSVNTTLLRKINASLSNGRTVLIHNFRVLYGKTESFLAANRAICLIVLAVIPTAYVMSAIFPDFHIWTLRAFFMFYPFLSLVVAGVLFWLHGQWKIPATALLVITGILLVRGHGVATSPFLFREGYEKIRSRVKNADVIVVLDSKHSAMRLANFCVPLLRADQVYVITVDEGSYRDEMINALATADKKSEIVVINTIGAPPYNAIASAVMGPELALTNDPILQSALEQNGYTLTIERHAAQLFQWFNLYKIGNTS